MSYHDYIESKMHECPASGFDCGDLNPSLFDYQAAIVRWALRRGRAAIFADCGMGKTLMQLEWAHRVSEFTGDPVLILCPLAVAEQTAAEAERFGIDARVSRDGTIESGIVITNYEQRDKFNIADFAGIVLDESSILKSFNGKTRTDLLRMSQSVPYRLACTATPAPNDHTELGNHAQFCGIMSREEMLASFFVHDTGGNVSDWRLKGHAREAFWRWVAMWAVCIRKPSDIGFCDDGFDLPELVMREHMIEVSRETSDGMLFRMEARSLSELRAESKRTMPARVEKIAAMVNQSSEPWVVWCHTNAEDAALSSMIPDAVSVKGSDDPELKASRMLGFSRGEHRVIITKPSIAGFGMNWQHCRNVAFVGLTHSYEQFYQAVRRCWRFGQDSDVNVHVAFAETEAAVIRSITKKQKSADEMGEEMTKAMRESSIENVQSLSAMRDEYSEGIHVGDDFEIHLGDSCEKLREVESDSVGMMVFSPPFASLFTYSNSPRDLGNCSSGEDFEQHFGFIVDELYRVLMPGRVCAVHVMQLMATKSRDGYVGIKDFRGDIIRLFESKGFVLHSEVCIWKDPVTAMQRTKAHGLLYKTLCKDSARSRQGLPDYLCIFAKPGENASPVSSGGERFSDYVGTSGPAGSPDSDARRYSIDVWQRYASPVWFDINQGRTLNYRDGRHDDDERHICPLQLDVIERAIHLWSNPGDLVLTPFMGIGSEVVSAVKMGRRAWGCELKSSYFDLACRNIDEAVEPSPQVDMFA
jgi:hypothetical protein